MIRTGRERKARRKIKALQALLAKKVQRVEKKERIKKNPLLASKKGIKATPVNFFEEKDENGSVSKVSPEKAKMVYQGGRVSLADLAKEGYPLKRD